jgi:hypothetical protein
MLGRLFNLYSALTRKTRGGRPSARRAQKSFTPGLEEFESRLVPSSVPLHVAGAQLVDPNGNPVVLRGVNISGLESYPTGLTGDANQVLRSADVALNDWHANLIRLTVYSDFWFGHDEGVGLGEVDPTPYRALVDQIVAKAAAQNAYVMLTVWGSDMGDQTLRPDLRDLPDDGTNAFWQNAATHTMLVDAQGNGVVNGPSYANNPAVMFDPFNEPHDDGSGQVGWAQWLKGGSVTETAKEGKTLTYTSPGMQGLLDTIRNAGANNVVAPEGLGYGADLSGVGAGFALIDHPGGNLMYQLHLYPAQWQSAADGDALVQPLGGKYAVYVGELGTPSGPDDPATAVNGVPNPDAPTWTRNMLAWVEQHGYSWTAWSLAPNTPPSLISDWNYTPTDYFGTIVKDSLTAHAANAAATSAALSALETALQSAVAEYQFAALTNSPGLGLASASYSDSLVAYATAKKAADTQSAALWAKAEQYASMAYGNALNDSFIGNPYASVASTWDLAALGLAGAVSTPERV